MRMLSPPRRRESHANLVVKNKEEIVIDNVYTIPIQVVKMITKQASKKIEMEVIAVVLVSMNMKAIDSCSLIQSILRKSPESVCIALASGSDVQQAIKALEVGAVDYFQRPIRDWARFFHLIRQSMQVWERTCELNALKSHMVSPRDPP